MPKRKAPMVTRSKTPGVSPATKRTSWFRISARLDYVTDPDSNTIEWHYKRTDRDYQRAVPFLTFQEWAREDGWTDGRAEYWRNIEKKVREAYADRMLKLRLEELEELTELRSEMSQFLKPLRDDDGNIRKDPATGLPIMPLEMPKYHQFVAAFLDLDERIMLRRGEAISRTESHVTSGANEDDNATPNDPLGSRVSLDKETLRAMTRTLLKMQASTAEDEPPALPPGDEEETE